jgi:hypothetical protein
MRFFKPELLARCRSSDDDVADAAAKEWDAAAAAYRARFQSIRAKLPLGVRRLVSSVSLHDARFLVVAIGKEKPFFGILVQVAGSSGQAGEVLELDYDSVAGPIGGVHVRSHPSLADSGQGNVQILYHEFDIDEAHSFFLHTVLLSDGREIEVRFRRLALRRL